MNKTPQQQLQEFHDAWVNFWKVVLHESGLYRLLCRLIEWLSAKLETPQEREQYERKKNE